MCNAVMDVCVLQWWVSHAVCVCAVQWWVSQLSAVCVLQCWGPQGSVRTCRGGFLRAVCVRAHVVGVGYSEQCVCVRVHVVGVGS